ncbi:DUF1462 family protein [Pseudalkalibacillus caeni]|uniref:DUF1462 family protein n=1 Tax=Exobacillus caeni TaxID=2574798 RepID=A0A5R9F9C3_9BACL|nr:DUF1462 family protein [Pseudalkalibacillus caeni]TLS38840.1 DUF1462 family protein [Pseudalkalibacillus caeni]
MKEILVYGAKERCAACVNLPSSFETAEWLSAALNRKYPEKEIHVRYVDIFNPEGDEESIFSERVIEEDLFYPVIVMNDEIISEGNPRLKDIYKAIEEGPVSA